MRRLYYFLQCSSLVLRLLKMAGGALVWLVLGCWAWIGQVIASIWVGIPTGVKRLAQKWTDEAIRRGFDSRYSDHLYKAFLVAAFIATGVGWIGYAYLTVLAVNWLLHW